MMRLITVITCLIVLASCATPSTKRMEIDSEAKAAEAAIQKQLAFDKQYEYTNRLYNISSRILESSAPLCPDDVIKTMSITGADKKDFGKDWIVEAEKRFEIGDGYVVTWLSGDGGGAKAGLEVNDKILAVNGVEYGSKKKERKLFLSSLGEIKNSTSDFASLKIMRSDEILDVSVPLKESCGFGVRLDYSDVVNAYADGKDIIITKGMMRFADDDNELALVIAHELGHNVMDHIDKKKPIMLWAQFLILLPLLTV